jgi:hypothetical protein
MLLTSASTAPLLDQTYHSTGQVEDDDQQYQTKSEHVVIRKFGDKQLS